MLYYSLEFQTFLQAVVGGEPEVLVARREGEIVGALPFFRKTVSGLGTIVNSLPWYGSHGGCVLAHQEDREARTAMLGALRALVAVPDLLTATVILSPSESAALADYEAVLSPQTQDRRIGQITELPSAGPDAPARLERVLLQKTRNLVRKSLRQGFEEAVLDEDWAWRFLFETHSENLVAIGGKAKPWEHFVALRTKLPVSMRRLSVAMHAGRPVAAMLCIGFNRTIEYLTPAVKLEYRSRQPLTFLIWHGMLTAIERDFRWWNWGGTWVTQKSLHHFKAGWGAIDRPYTYLVLLGPGRYSDLRHRKAEILHAFSYYYVYPFSDLDRDPA